MFLQLEYSNDINHDPSIGDFYQGGLMFYLDTREGINTHHLSLPGGDVLYRNTGANGTAIGMELKIL